MIPSTAKLKLSTIEIRRRPWPVPGRSEPAPLVGLIAEVVPEARARVLTSRERLLARFHLRAVVVAEEMQQPVRERGAARRRPRPAGKG